MIAWFCNWFVKLTGWIPQLFIFKVRTYYQDKSRQSKRIKGKAIIISNHLSLYDFACMLFVFWNRTLRCVVADIMFRKNFWMNLLLRALGAIKANRETHDFTFISRCKKILDKGGVVEFYPEARLPRPDDKELPNQFRPSVVYLALESGAPIIPVYTNGKYFVKENARVIIGTPIMVRDLYDDNLSQKENISNITSYLRGKIIELKDELERQVKEEAEGK